MNLYKSIAASFLVIAIVLSTFAKQDEDFGSGAIKTDYGFLLVWNSANNRYTMEIHGQNVRQISTEQVQFNVDGMFLQVVNAKISEFVEGDKRKGLDDKAILDAHKMWEVRYIEKQIMQTLTVDRSEAKQINGKETLYWSFLNPSAEKSNVKKQVYLSMVNNDNVVLIGGVTTDKVTDAATQQLLEATAKTFKTSNEPINLRKIQTQIREEVKSKVGSFKGRVVLKDTNKPVAGASVTFIDEERSNTRDNSEQLKTDSEGNYSVRLLPGKYTITIVAGYKTQDEAPCKLLLGKTSDKDSAVVVVSGNVGVEQRVVIKNFVVKAGDDLVKDFDFSCKSIQEK